MLDLQTGASETRVRLPKAAGMTQVKTGHGAASLTLEVPAGVAARIRTRMALGSSRGRRDPLPARRRHLPVARLRDGRQQGRHRRLRRSRLPADHRTGADRPRPSGPLRTLSGADANLGAMTALTSHAPIASSEAPRRSVAAARGRRDRLPRRQPRAHRADVGPPRRARRARHRRRHRDRDRAAHRAVRHVPGAHPAPADVAAPRGSTGRSGATGSRPPIAGSASGASGCSSRTACSRPSASRSPTGEPVRRGLDAHHDLGLRADGDGQPGACSSPSPSRSIRLARKRISYESWYGIHLYAYLAIALGFAHQLVVGTDFIDDPLARVYWVGLYVVDIGCSARVPLRRADRRQRPPSVPGRQRRRARRPGVVSVYLSGRDLDRLAIRAGQYVIVRFLTGGLVARAPVLISAAAQRPVAAAHGQGARRRLGAARAARDRHPRHRRGPVRQPHRRAAHGAIGSSWWPAASASRRCGPCSRSSPPRPASPCCTAPAPPSTSSSARARHPRPSAAPGVRYLVGSRRAGDRRGPAGFRPDPPRSSRTSPTARSICAGPTR